MKHSSANKFPHDVQNSDETNESQAHHQHCNRRNLQTRTFVGVKLDHAPTSLARAGLGPSSCECFVHERIRCIWVSHASRLEATFPLLSPDHQSAQQDLTRLGDLCSSRRLRLHGIGFLGKPSISESPKASYSVGSSRTRFVDALKPSRLAYACSCSSCSDLLESADDDVCYRRNRGSLPLPPRARFRPLVFPRTCSASEGGCTRPSSSFRHHGRRHCPCNARAFVRHQRSRSRINRSRFAADGRISPPQTPPVRAWVARGSIRFKSQEQNRGPCS